MADYGIIVAGNGNTTRANVEALIEDYILSKDDKGTMILAFESKPSGAQIWAGQLAAAHSLDVIIVAEANSILDSAPKGSFVESNDPATASVDILATINLAEKSAYIVWSDEDPFCASVLAGCKKHGIGAFDLTNGLVSIIPTEYLKPTEPIIIPEAEKIVDHIEEEQSAEPEVESDEDETEDEEEEVEDVFYAAIAAFAEMVAEIVLERLKDSK